MNLFLLKLPTETMSVESKIPADNDQSSYIMIQFSVLFSLHFPRKAVFDFQSPKTLRKKQVQ